MIADTTIKIDRNTKERLTMLKGDGESFNDVVNRLIDENQPETDYEPLTMVRSVKVPKGTVPKGIERYILEVHELIYARDLCSSIAAKKAIDTEIKRKVRLVIRYLKVDVSGEVSLEGAYNVALYEHIWAGKPENYMADVPDIMEVKK